MNTLLIVFASDYGNTDKMAQTIAAGARSVNGTEVIVKKAEETTVEDLKKSDGIILGTPVHMGSMDWRMKKFIDSVCSTLWMQNGLIGKVGGVFASGSGFGNGGGGSELAMLSLLSNIAELGMVVVPLPKSTPGYSQGGLHWGPYCRSANAQLEPVALSEEALQAAYHHGVHIARVAALIKSEEVFSD